MNGRIFLLDEDSGITPMTESPYDSEALLQKLLSEHPDLLAGDQIAPDEPRRWQLVSREMGVPDGEDGPDRWAIDHLFLDQDGVPTLVEVKRSSDSRIRREVVGQMLDYAANAVAYWPVEQVRLKFEARCEAAGLDPEQTLREFARSDSDAGDFWQRVKTNLSAGRIRMVFVADVIPTELRRVVEFLNEQMDPAEVLAIEVRQFVGRGLKTLVPQLFGQTENARGKKASRGAERAEKIGQEDFLRAFDAHHKERDRAFIRRIVEWSGTTGLAPSFSQKTKHATFIPVLKVAERNLYPLSIWDTGQIWVQMRWLKNHPPFSDPASRAALQERLSGITGLSVTDAGMEGFPRLTIAGLKDEADLDRFLGAMDWLVAACRKPPDAEG